MEKFVLFDFLEELKRRNVFRVGFAYAVFGWLLIQIVDTVIPYFGLPEWVPGLIISLTLIGLPISLLLAWVYELTSEGIIKTETAELEDAKAPRPDPKLNYIVIVGLVVALAYFVWESRFSTLESTIVQDLPAASSSMIADKSIAVLPFADFSQRGDQQWFTDGLAEEILNTLVKTPDLNVASRTSSFAFKNSNLDIKQIADDLGVAHILEGSVRRSDTRLRITAQLIRADDGFHLWSENFDRSPSDAISIQEEIAISISEALQTAMDPEALATMVDVGTDSIAAYNAYLEALALIQQSEFQQAQLGLYQKPIDFDPEFSEAHYQMALYLAGTLAATRIAVGTGLTEVEVLDRARAHITQAIQYSEDSVDSLKYGALQADLDLRLLDNRNLLRAYLEERPNDSMTWIELLNAENYLGDLEGVRQAIDKIVELSNDSIVRLQPAMQAFHRVNAAELGADIARRLIVEDTSSELRLYQAQRALLWAGDVAAAATAAQLFEQTLSRNIEGYDDNTLLMVSNLRQACAEGREQDAAQIAASIETSASPNVNDNISGQWHRLTILGRYEEAEELLRFLDTPDQIRSLLSFVPYPHFDATPFPYLMDVLAQQSAQIQPFVPLPFACK